MSFGQDTPKVDTTLEAQQAQIAREQYDDYLRRFKPVESEVLADINNDAAREQTIADAGRVSDAGFDSALKAAEIQRSRTGFGAVTNADAVKVGTRRLGLARALANVNTQNQTRIGLRDRLLATTAGQIEVGRDIGSTGLSGLSSAAGLEAKENARARQAIADDHTQSTQAIGTGVATLASALSSREFKTNIRSVDVADLLALIQQIQPVTFEYKPELFPERDGTFIGAIAEDVPEEFAANGRTELHVYNLIGALIGSVQALADRIRELESR